MHRPYLFLFVAAAGGCAPEQPAPRAPFLPEVYVEYRADDRAAVLERRYRDMPWIPVCSSPCQRTVRPDFEYRVAGEGIVPSPPFRLYEATTINAHAGSRGSRAAGIVGVSVGAPLMFIGGYLAMLMVDSGNSGAFWTGTFIFGTGTLLTVGGGWALSDNHTTVQLRERSPIAKVTFKF